MTIMHVLIGRTTDYSGKSMNLLISHAQHCGYVITIKILEIILLPSSSFIDSNGQIYLGTHFTFDTRNYQDTCSKLTDIIFLD